MIPAEFLKTGIHAIGAAANWYNDKDKQNYTDNNTIEFISFKLYLMSMFCPTFVYVVDRTRVKTLCCTYISSGFS